MTRVPRLPRLMYSLEELRERLQDLPLALHLVDLLEAHQQRDAHLLHELRDLVMACEGRQQVPAHFVHAKSLDLVMGIYASEGRGGAQ